MIIFLKSTNTDSFGLRGYWAHDKATLSLWSFATSNDLAIGDDVNPRDYVLPCLEVPFQTVTHFNKFLTVCPA
jgi:hypothetical protein